MTAAKKTKIAFIVQRYGVEVIGGAEAYARQLAEKIVSSLHWDVDVFTSAAKSYETWANVYPNKTDVINGVTVRRFKTLMPRLSLLFGPFNLLMNKLWAVMPSAKRVGHPPAGRSHTLAARAWDDGVRLLEHLWFLLQGPYCPGLLSDLRRRHDDYDACFFVTYLYYPAVYGWKIAGRKAVLIPTAHDEPPFYSQLVGEMLRGIPRLLALSAPERQLLAKRLGAAENSIPLLGYGLDINASGVLSPGMSDILSTDKRPYVLYLGRLSQGKRVNQLIDWFTAYNRETGAQYRLLLAGQKEANLQIPQTSDITYCGQVTDEDKAQLIKGAAILFNPSPYESLSMIVIEAMLLRVPVVVNTGSEVLKHYADVNPTVWGYRDQTTFNASLKAVEAARGRTAEFDQALTATQIWAQKTFSWDTVLEVVKTSILRQFR